MAVNWSFAAQVGGVGFGMVFGLLCVLALVIGLTGRIISKRISEKKKD
jgi:Na+-transporting methylmalonyl-CoA/oxaloacetate decarboxylase gamma subunit